MSALWRKSSDKTWAISPARIRKLKLTNLHFDFSLLWLGQGTFFDSSGQMLLL